MITANCQERDCDNVQSAICLHCQQYLCVTHIVDHGKLLLREGDQLCEQINELAEQLNVYLKQVHLARDEATEKLNVWRQNQIDKVEQKYAKKFQVIQFRKDHLTHLENQLTKRLTEEAIQPLEYMQTRQNASSENLKTIRQAITNIARESAQLDLCLKDPSSQVSSPPVVNTTTTNNSYLSQPNASSQQNADTKTHYFVNSAINSSDLQLLINNQSPLQQTTSIATNQATTTMQTISSSSSASTIPKPTPTASAFITSKPTGTVLTSKPTETVLTSKPTETVLTSKPTETVLTSKPTSAASASTTPKPTETVLTSKPTETVLTSKPTSAASASTTPKPTATASASTTPKPTATASASTTPKPTAIASASTTPKPKATASASTTPKPKATASASTTPKPKATASASTTPKPTIIAAASALPIFSQTQLAASVSSKTTIKRPPTYPCRNLIILFKDVSGYSDHNIEKFIVKNLNQVVHVNNLMVLLLSLLEAWHSPKLPTIINHDVLRHHINIVKKYIKGPEQQLTLIAASQVFLTSFKYDDKKSSEFISGLLQFFFHHQCITKEIALDWYQNGARYGYVGFEKAKLYAKPFIDQLNTKIESK